MTAWRLAGEDNFRFMISQTNHAAWLLADREVPNTLALPDSLAISRPSYASQNLALRK